MSHFCLQITVDDPRSKVGLGEIQRRRSIDVGCENIGTKKWGADIKRCVASEKKKKVGIKWSTGRVRQY